VSEDYGMGMTEESFHLLGNFPVEIDWLNSLVTGAAMLAAVALTSDLRSCQGHLILKYQLSPVSGNTSSSEHKRETVDSGALSDIATRTGLFMGR
jgi:hypothetical protein